MTILSIVLAYIVNGSMSAPDARRFTTSAVTSPLLNLLRPDSTVINRSLSTPFLAITSSGSAVSLSSLKDFGVAVFKPSSVSSDITTGSSSQNAQSTASSSSSTAPAVTATTVDGPAECECGCGLVTWPAKTDTTELMLRPTGSGLSVLTNAINSISVVPSHTPVGKGKGKAVDPDNSLYALSTRMANSLSEYLGFSPIAQAIATDIQELIAAVDQLAQAISRNAAMALDQSMTAVAVLRVELKQRNERAKERARQIREAGEVWYSTLKEHFKTRSQAAKENAHRIKHHVGDHRKSRATRKAERRRVRQVKRMERLEKRAERKMANA